MAYSALEATTVATHATRILRTRCIEGIEAHEDPAREKFREHFANRHGADPELGYELTANLVKEALTVGKSVLELVRERKLIDEPSLPD